MEDFLNDNGPLVVIWLLCGMIAGSIASARGQGFAGWFLVGILLGPLGVLGSLFVSRSPELEAKRQLEVEEAKRRLGGSAASD